MKNKYFKFIQIDSGLIKDLLKQHPKLNLFINSNLPFDVRINTKPYSGLIHNIICQDAQNEEIVVVASKLIKCVKKIEAKRINKLNDQDLIAITNNTNKALLIKNITQDVVSKKLDLKKLSKLPTDEIINILSNYKGLSLNTIKQFILFSFFKQDILCTEDIDFLNGLKIYLNKKDINKQDIINIEQEFEGQYTLFSLCMWRINNERNKK